MPSILVIGSSGFIGSHIAAHFGQHGWKVSGADILGSPVDGMDFFKVGPATLDWEQVFHATQADFCVNAAGSGSVGLSIDDPVRDFRANAFDTIVILDTIRKKNPSCKYLHISSAAVYGNPKSLPVKEDSELRPVSPYGWHKLIAENICREYFDIFGLSLAIVRPFSVFGAGLKKQLLWDIGVKLSKSDQIELFGTGQETRDFIHVQDLACCLEKICVNGRFQAEVYNIGNGEETPIARVASIFTSFFPGNKKIGFSGNVKEGDPVNWQADISLLKSLGYQRSYTLDDGVREYISWFVKNME